MQKITIEKYKIGEIPVLTYFKEGLDKYPLIFFIHGFTAGKEQGIELGYYLAEKGFYFVSIDAYMHGERYDGRLADSWTEGKTKFPAKSGLEIYYLMYQIILQTSKDVETLIAHFSKNNSIDVNRIGIAGFSMGANAAFYISANNPMIKAAVPIMGYPAFYERWQYILAETSMNSKWMKDIEPLQYELDNMTLFFKSIDPSEKIKEFAPKPMLMICGKRDISCPKEYSILLFKELKPLYSEKPDNMKLNIHDFDHQFCWPVEMDCCNWFCTHLL